MSEEGQPERKSVLKTVFEHNSLYQAVDIIANIDKRADLSAFCYWRKVADGGNKLHPVDDDEIVFGGRLAVAIGGIGVFE